MSVAFAARQASADGSPSTTPAAVLGSCTSIGAIPQLVTRPRLGIGGRRSGGASARWAHLRRADRDLSAPSSDSILRCLPRSRPEWTPPGIPPPTPHPPAHQFQAQGINPFYSPTRRQSKAHSAPARRIRHCGTVVCAPGTGFRPPRPRSVRQRADAAEGVGFRVECEPQRSTGDQTDGTVTETQTIEEAEWLCRSPSNRSPIGTSA